MLQSHIFRQKLLHKYTVDDGFVWSWRFNRGPLTEILNFHWLSYVVSLSVGVRNCVATVSHTIHFFTQNFLRFLSSMVPNTTMMTYNDGSVGTAVQVTGVQSSLRSSRDKGHDETDASFDHGDDDHHPEEEDAALEIAEEKLMDGDEEIESCDENGKPVVDTEKLERRMMTVALMKSVVETSSAKVPTDFSSEAGEDEKDDSGVAGEHANHSYGLRKKRSRHSSGRHNLDDEPGPRRTGAPTRAHTDAVPIPASSCFASTIPLPAPPTLPGRIVPKIVQVMEGNSRQSGTVNQANAPISDGLHSSPVPNPLMHATPPAGNTDVNCLQSLAPAIPSNTMSASLPPVPCPLPTSTTNNEQRPDFAPSASLTAAGKTSECATTVSKRGRIFSIDIDREYRGIACLLLSKISNFVDSTLCSGGIGISRHEH
jgi:hypothetical protein